MTESQFFDSVLFAFNFVDSSGELNSYEKSFINPTALTKSRYFIIKKTPFFVNGERYFEVALQLEGKFATKFNRLTVYTKINFSSKYSIQIAYSDVNFTLWGKSNTIKFVTGWRVSIAPTCLNLLGKILQIPLQLNRSYGEYNSFMDFLTETGMTLLDLINLNDNRFNQVISKLFERTNTQHLYPVLMQLRNCYSYQSNQFGSHTIRYLLLNFREEVLEALLPSADDNKQMLGDFCLSRKCFPFEKNPFISPFQPLTVCAMQSAAFLRSSGNLHPLYIRLILRRLSLRNPRLLNISIFLLLLFSSYFGFTRSPPSHLPTCEAP